jgi:hypothetical protein
MRERVEYVSDRDETTRQRDCGSHESVRIAVAVPALMV